MNEQVQQRSWFGRNWLWILPVGGCLTVILLFVFGIGATIFGVSKALANSEPYEYAVSEGSHSQDLIAVIGEPIETNGIMQGTLNFKNNGGSVDISIPLKGPNGEARVFVKGEKYDGDWHYEELYVIISGTTKKINLLE